MGERLTITYRSSGQAHKASFETDDGLKMNDELEDFLRGAFVALGFAYEHVNEFFDYSDRSKRG